MVNYGPLIAGQVHVEPHLDVDITVVMQTPMARAMTLGTMIRRLRQDKGLTQQILAARAKVTQGYIAQLEAGTRQRLSLEVADRLARALGVEVADLLRGGRR